MSPKIRHDRSATSVVSSCSACPFWYAFNWDLERARHSGARHLELTHDVPSDKSRDSINAANRRARLAEQFVKRQ